MAPPRSPPSPRSRALIAISPGPTSAVNADLIQLSAKGRHAFKLGRFEQAVGIYTTALSLCEQESLPSDDRAVFYINRACARLRQRTVRTDNAACVDAEKAKGAARPTERPQYDLALLMVKAKDVRLTPDFGWYHHLSPMAQPLTPAAQLAQAAAAAAAQLAAERHTARVAAEIAAKAIVAAQLLEEKKAAAEAAKIAEELAAAARIALAEQAEIERLAREEARIAKEAEDGNFTRNLLACLSFVCARVLF